MHVGTEVEEVAWAEKKNNNRNEDMCCETTARLRYGRDGNCDGRAAALTAPATAAPKR